jgi:hypothetical protein
VGKIPGGQIIGKCPDYQINELWNVHLGTPDSLQQVAKKSNAYQ